MPILRVGTRGSRLALIQTEQVVDALRLRHPEIEPRVHILRTEGDRKLRASLSEIGGQGVFVRELERALSSGEIDLAVHSLKDVPADILEGLSLSAYLRRQDPRDVLVSRGGLRLADLAPGARVGTGSVRRSVQARALRPDLQFVDIRGNVDTRVRSVDEGKVDAVILAAAGLARLGCLDRVSEAFEPDAITPAVGQGAIAVETREGDGELRALLSEIDDRETRLAVQAERAFLRRLGGCCTMPAGALADVRGDAIRVRAFLADESGEHASRAEMSGPVDAGEELGARLAECLIAQLSKGAVACETE